VALMAAALSTNWTYHSRAGWKIDLLVSGATIFAVGALYRAAERLTALLVLNWNHTLPSRSAAAIALTFTSILSGVNVSCNAESNVLRRADNQPQSMWQPAYNRLFAPAVSIPPFSIWSSDGKMCSLAYEGSAFSHEGSASLTRSTAFFPCRPILAESAAARCWN
jgi:hypothetical protein